MEPIIRLGGYGSTNLPVHDVLGPYFTVGVQASARGLSG